MTINSEQIQALEASALAATTGDWTADDNFGFTIQCYRTGTNRLLATVNGPNAENYMRFIAQASPQNILRVLAEREADKALIAEQEKRIAELEQRHCGGALMEREDHHVGVVNKLLERIAELEAIQSGNSGKSPTVMPDFEGISALTQRECYQAGLEVGIARVAGIPEGVKTALSEAVAAIHFTDSSDYLPALFAVVKALSPTTYHLLLRNPKQAFDATRSPCSVPAGYVLVPIEPTESMIINGFESEPDESFSEPDVWEAYEAMSGCQQAAHRAKLCWAAMIAAAPKGV